MNRSPPTPQQLVEGIQRTLTAEGIDFEWIIREFDQVAACERRERGQTFSLRDHVRGLILSQLSNQRPWRPIAQNLERIADIFLDFDPSALELARPQDLVQGLLEIRCGNRSVAAQMEVLAENIRTFRRIERKHISVDNFVTSADPDSIARRLSAPGEFKLHYVGYTLAFEYLRNVGIRAAKPDVHVRRIISQARLGYSNGHPSEEEAQRLVAKLAQAVPCNPSYLDNLLWLFCAKDYGDVCGANPRCDVCSLRSKCNYPPEMSV